MIVLRKKEILLIVMTVILCVKLYNNINNEW